jgi:hypothetical protein
LREHYAAERPGIGAITDARALATIYAALLTEVAGVRLMNRDTLTSSNSDHPSNITNWAQCTRAREDDRRTNGDRNCETASALSAFDKRK